jgi:hypothetical protein
MSVPIYDYALANDELKTLDMADHYKHCRKAIVEGAYTPVVFSQGTITSVHFATLTEIAKLIKK